MSFTYTARQETSRLTVGIARMCESSSCVITFVRTTECSAPQLAVATSIDLRDGTGIILNLPVGHMEDITISIT